MPEGSDLIERAAGGDRLAQSEVDIAVDAAVNRGDFAAVDEFLRPLAEEARRSEPAMEFLLGLLDNHRIVRSTVAKHVTDEQLIEEASQDALLSIAQHIHQYEGRSRFTTWVFPIAANAGRMATRGQSRRPDAGARSQLPEIDPSLRRMSSVIVSADQIRQAVSSLPDHYRQPFELREYGGRSYSEIAEDLGLTVGTVKSRIARAREHVAEQLLR